MADSIVVTQGVTGAKTLTTAPAAMFLPGADNHLHLAGPLAGRVGLPGTVDAVRLASDYRRRRRRGGRKRRPPFRGRRLFAGNLGLVDSLLWGVFATGIGGRIVNHGTIKGDVSVFGSSGTDSLASAGLMDSDVDLRGGDDSFDGAGGTVHGLMTWARATIPPPAARGRPVPGRRRR